MAIALLPLQTLFVPLQSAVHWLAGGTAPARPARAAAARSAPTLRSVAQPRQRPLRVVRVWEGPLPPARAGRMVISGRMADVCAELDRLAALEQQPPRH